MDLLSTVDSSPKTKCCFFVFFFFPFPQAIKPQSPGALGLPGSGELRRLGTFGLGVE